MNEFDLISEFFAPLSTDGLVNDGAVLCLPDGHDLVVSSDTLNAGVHFIDSASPEDIAHKALRVNLSDLASMGAVPLAYQLNIAFPEKPSRDWLERFTGTLRVDQEHFGITCSGGDTTGINGALSISITAMGTVKSGTAWKRSGAQDGDALVLTGPVGDAWIGLQVLRGKIMTEDDAYFIERYYKPTPRLGLSGAHVRAAIDISDGFMADLQHMCKASGVGADITLDDHMFSAQAKKLLEQERVTIQDLLSGGDDYELLLAVLPEHAERYGQVVGTFRAGAPRVHVMDGAGDMLDIKHTGWSHF